MKKCFSSHKLVAISILLVSSIPAYSSQGAAPDFSPITGAIDVSGVVAGVLAIAAAIVGVLVAIRGVRFIMTMLGYGSSTIHRCQ